MANETDRKVDGSETILVAHVTAHFNTGESMELLPFFDENDVKSKVTALIGDWAKTGYLLKGAQIYPWHQVRLVEATSVVEISRTNSEEQVVGEHDLEISHAQQGFWKTKEAGNGSGESKSGQ